MQGWMVMGMAELLQKVNRNEKSTCGKCSHRFVCFGIENQPCFECNRFEKEVVRCKDCQEYDPGLIRPYLGWCSVWDTAVRETGFCHHGKPRSEEKPKPEWPPQEEMEEPCED